MNLHSLNRKLWTFRICSLFFRDSPNQSKSRKTSLASRVLGIQFSWTLKHLKLGNFETQKVNKILTKLLKVWNLKLWHFETQNMKLKNRRILRLKFWGSESSSKQSLRSARNNIANLDERDTQNLVIEVLKSQRFSVEVHTNIGTLCST